MTRIPILVLVVLAMACGGTSAADSPRLTVDEYAESACNSLLLAWEGPHRRFQVDEYGESARLSWEFSWAKLLAYTEANLAILESLNPPASLESYHAAHVRVLRVNADAMAPNPGRIILRS